MVICQICKQEYKQISNTHLKFHNLTLIDYKEQFPNIEIVSIELKEFYSKRSSKANESRKGIKRSDEVKRKISETKKQRKYTAWNKGISMSEQQKEKLRELAIKRNKETIHPRKGKLHTEETKEKIRKKRQQQIITTEQALRAYETRVKNNNFTPPMKGKRHTEETKRKILEKTTIYRETRRKETNNQYIKKIENSNLKLLNDIDDHFLTLQCQICSTIFSRTKQIFQESKRNGQDVCDICYPKEIKHSKDELEIFEFIKIELEIEDLMSGNRKLIYPLEIDILSLSNNLGIEYCGLYYHSELNGKDRKYHLEKMKLCNNKGIDLITIFSDEWINNKDIVKSILRMKFNKCNQTIYARKCEIKEVTAKESNVFLKENHLQGVGRSNIRYGLFYNNELVSVMTFCKSNLSRKLKNKWELDRFCTIMNTNVVGGASRLLKAFRILNPLVEIITYADRRWSDGNFYEKIGFELESITPSNYWYIDNEKRKHRFSLRKNKDDNQQLTEWENRKQQGWDRIWDCGHYKFSTK